MEEQESETVPTRLYRFRPLTVVKPACVSGEHRPGKTVAEELDAQEIFIARLDELNDPMDGLHHTVWDGDSIVWKNFLVNYAVCLLDAVSFVWVAGDTATFDVRVIHSLKSPEDSPTDAYRALCDDIAAGIEANEELRTLVAELCRRQKLEKGELLALLSLHQMQFLREIAKALKSHLNVDVLPEMANGPSRVDLRSLAEILPVLGERVLGIAGEVGQRTNEQLYLIHRYNGRETHSVGRENLTRIVALFPNLYLEAAEKDVYGEFYVASFSKQPTESSMWAHYAEQHRGICLIFDVAEADGQAVIELAGSNGKIALHPVRYAADPPELNFFESLGRLPQAKIIAGWLGLDGEVSSVARVYDGSYPKLYWKRFIEKVSHKFTNWRVEQEVRIIRDTQFTGELEPADRLLHYKFEHLAGIIFGMRTPVEDQIRIIEVVERKLRNHPDKPFKFFKAAYSPTQSRFDIHELSLLQLSPSADADG